MVIVNDSIQPQDLLSAQFVEKLWLVGVQIVRLILRPLTDGNGQMENNHIRKSVELTTTLFFF